MCKHASFEVKLVQHHSFSRSADVVNLHSGSTVIDCMKISLSYLAGDISSPRNDLTTFTP